MEQHNRRGFFAFIGQCIAAAFVAPAVLPKAAEAIEPTTEANRISLSGYWDSASGYVKQETAQEIFGNHHAPFSQIDSELTRISLQYVPQDYIADKFMPQTAMDRRIERRSAHVFYKSSDYQQP